jgi:hypothetical protein
VTDDELVRLIAGTLRGLWVDDLQVHGSYVELPVEKVARLVLPAVREARACLADELVEYFTKRPHADPVSAIKRKALREREPDLS